MLFEGFELLQFVKEVQLSFLVGFDMIHSHLIGLFCVLLTLVLSLDLIEDCQLLGYDGCTPNFSLKDFDSYSTLWFMRVITIFLLYFRWSLMSLLN